MFFFTRKNLEFIYSVTVLVPYFKVCKPKIFVTSSPLVRDASQCYKYRRQKRNVFAGYPNTSFVSGADFRSFICYVKNIICV